MSGFFSKLFGPPTIKNTTLGILDLSGGSAKDVISADRASIGPLFASTLESSERPPACAVLLIYCSLDETGAIIGSTLGMRELIRDSGAKVAVFATPNPSKSYIAGGKKKGYGQANLVMTLDRRGAAFTTFFTRLFGEMHKGVSMPIAWVKLAPQIPGMDHAPDVPSTIFACELGQLKFG